MPSLWPSAVLVDLDNTLHDYRAAAAQARSALALRIEREQGVPREAVIERYEALIAAEAGTAAPTGQTMRLARLQSLLQCWPETRSVDGAPLAEFLGSALLDALRPFAGAIEAYRIIESKGVAMVLTEGHMDIQGAIARRLGLSTEPKRFLATKSRNVRKADGSAFRLAAKLLGIAASDMVMAGDNWRWDVLGAAKAALWQVWIAAGDESPEDTPRRYLGKVASLSELPAFLLERWRDRLAATSQN